MQEDKLTKSTPFLTLSLVKSQSIFICFAFMKNEIASLETLNSWSKFNQPSYLFCSLFHTLCSACIERLAKVPCFLYFQLIGDFPRTLNSLTLTFNSLEKMPNLNYNRTSWRESTPLSRIPCPEVAKMYLRMCLDLEKLEGKKKFLRSSFLSIVWFEEN